jgi:hypothetical protein
VANSQTRKKFNKSYEFTEENIEEVSALLRQMRESKELTRDDVEEKADLTYLQVRNIEYNHSIVPAVGSAITKLNEFASLFGYEVLLVMRKK